MNTTQLNQCVCVPCALPIALLTHSRAHSSINSLNGNELILFSVSKKYYRREISIPAYSTLTDYSTNFKLITQILNSEYTQLARGARGAAVCRMPKHLMIFMKMFETKSSNNLLFHFHFCVGYTISFPHVCSILRIEQQQQSLLCPNPEPNRAHLALCMVAVFMCKI